MKDTLKQINEQLLTISNDLRSHHAQDINYSPIRNNVPNAIVFIERAIDELKEVVHSGIMKIVK